MNRLLRLLTGRRSAPFIAGAAAAGWFVTTTSGGFAPMDLLSGLLAAVAALAAMAALTEAAFGPRDPRGHDLYGDGEAEGVEAGEGTREAASAVDLLLRDLARRVGAVRLTVWARKEEELRPLHAAGPLPERRPASGDPVVWALDEEQPFRTERVPDWARGPVSAAPLRAGDRRLAITAEGHAAAPDLAVLAEAAALLGPVLALAEQETRSRAASARLDRLVEFLKTLPGEAEPDDFPAHLARVAAQLTGGTGAAVASWQDESGRVLANWGTDGGPAEGTYFGVMDGELAMAARAGTTIRRTPGSRSPVLAQAGERWRRPPRHLVVVPLGDLTGLTRGLVAIWGDEVVEPELIGLLEALAPVLAIQLEHSTALVRLAKRAHEDILTGLANRTALEERLREAHNLFHRYRRPVALLVIDLDHFKHINDTYGHQAGDAVLERLGDIVRAATRETDFPARFGGEEIVVLLPETMLREAAEVAERIRRAIESTRVEWNGKVIPVTASIGVSACPDTVEEPEELMRTADAALYTSKEEGRNRVTIATSERSGA